MQPLALEALSVRKLRSLGSVDLTFSPKFNVLSGDNGQGKTNLLEAVYLLATSRSFRATKLTELVAFGSEVASVRGVLREGEETRAQSLGLQGGIRIARIDGKRPRSLLAYAVKSPVVVFHPGEVELSMGPSAERRKLLDRVALYLAPSTLADLEAYGRCIRERQRALDTRGPGAKDLEDWEAVAASHGLRVMEGRALAASRLAVEAEIAFERIGAPGLTLKVGYAPSAPRDEADFRRALAEARPRDLRRGAATVGPHRDELRLELAGHVARGTASQGQHRSLVLALKSAEIEVVAAARGTRPILLLDDVSSELDASRTGALFAFLREHRGQVLLTTTRPELIAIGGAEERKDFHVLGGTIVPL